MLKPNDKLFLEFMQKKREEKIMPSLMANLSCCRTHFTLTNLTKQMVRVLGDTLYLVIYL